MNTDFEVLHAGRIYPDGPPVETVESLRAELETERGRYDTLFREYHEACVNATKLQARLNDLHEPSLLRLVADLRFAIGDDGKRMQPELVEYARQMRADTERYRWILDWLSRKCLLRVEKCQPEAGMKVGNYWVFRGPAIIDGARIVAWADTAEAAIDAARSAK